MATITIQGKIAHTCGELPAVGTTAPDFELVKGDLTTLKRDDLAGKRLVLNIFPSLDTGVCAVSVRKFNRLAENMDNTVVLAVSKDLPFAQSRFCTVENIRNLIPLSAFRSDDFAERYGLKIVDGPMQGLLARAVVVVGTDGKIVYTELVPEITDEPDYEAARAALD